MPTKTWAVGEEVLAADFNTMLQGQVIATFPNAAARTAALAAPAEGMVTYLADAKSYQRWTGSAWAPVTEVAAAQGNGAYPARFRAASVVQTSDAAGNIATPVGPLGNVAAILVNPGDKQSPMSITPYRAQFTAGATNVTWYVMKPDGTALANSTIRFDFLIVET